MADNVTIPATGTGTATPVVATDEVGGAHYQRVKLDLGANGLADPVVGAVPVSGIVTVADPVSVDDNGGSLTVDGSVSVANFPATQAVSGTVTANAGTGPFPVSDNGGSLTVDGTVSVSGTVDTELTTADLDTGAGTDTRAVVGLIGSKSGGGALIPGDATAGLKVDLGADNDVTVTGSVTANAGTNLNTSLLALETGGNLAGAATSLGVIDDWDESDRAKINPIVGQAGVAAGSGVVGVTTQRVVLATDVALPAGTNAIGKLAANSGVDIGDVDVTSLPALSAGTNNIGDVDVLTVPSPLSTAGNGTAATAHRVTIASDSTGQITANAGTGTFTTKETRAGTGTTTSVGSSATSVTLLASNANRLGATIFNDSTQNLFVKMGATASSTSFAVKMTPGTYYEVPFGYTGVIDGIWASANGNARLTELT